MSLIKVKTPVVEIDGDEIDGGENDGDETDGDHTDCDDSDNCVDQNGNDINYQKIMMDSSCNSDSEIIPVTPEDVSDAETINLETEKQIRKQMSKILDKT